MLVFLVSKFASADLSSQSTPSLYVVGTMTYNMQYILDKFLAAVKFLETAIIGFAEVVRFMSGDNSYFIVGLYFEESGIHAACRERVVSDIDEETGAELPECDRMLARRGRANRTRGGKGAAAHKEAGRGNM